MERALILSIGNNIGLTRLPGLLRAGGLEVHVCSDDRGHVLHSAHIAERHLCPREAEPRRRYLEELLAWRWDRIIPGDDVALRFLVDDGRPAFLAALPVDLARVGPAVVRDKGAFTRWILTTELPTPRTAIATSAAEAAAWWTSSGLGRVLLKPLEGQGGVGIFVPSSEAHLREQWPESTGAMLVQEFVTGPTFVAEWLMEHGEVRGLVLSRKTRARGAFGFSTERAYAAPAPAEALAREVGRLTGFHGFGGADLIQRPDGSLAILEIRFRPTSCLHWTALGGCDFARVLRGEPAATPIDPGPHPLFPELVSTELVRAGAPAALRQLLSPRLWRRMSWNDRGALARHWWKVHREWKRRGDSPS